MDIADIRERFDREVRANPPTQVGRVTEWCDGVLRHTVSYNFIDWWDFGPERSAEIAAREAAFYRPLGDLKWKVYSHDAPANLGAALEAAGFVVGGHETFLALDLDAQPDWPAPPGGVEVRRIVDSAGVADMMAVNEAAFGEPGSWTVEFLTARLADPTLALYVAYADGRPVSSGRLEFCTGTAFAGIYGGGTVPDHRGRGTYRALVAARVREARERGYRYLTVDARPTSRPILLRLGFEAVSELTAWRLRAAE
ncbi:MAG TPA: GNAT family N-acetyltransferase [Caulobacteraceae bacterium]|jgi:GNAT superfamily N-acetyltransferase|nr:GNAT family N-acetyltransferase [Caulobacteraceae bacterium]